MSLQSEAVSNALAPVRGAAPHVQWRMIQSAFAPMLQPAPMALLPVVGGLGAFTVTGNIWFFAWALLSLVAILACHHQAARMALSKRNCAPSSWAMLYVACAWGEAATLGAGGALAAAQTTMIACAIMIGPLAFVAAHAMGHAVFARAAQGRVLLLLAPLAITSLASLSPAFMALGVTSLLLAGWALALLQQANADPDAAASPPAPATASTASPQEVSFQEKFGRDPDTGFPNKPRFVYVLAQESLRAMQSAAPLSLLVIQCDAPETVPPHRPEKRQQAMAARAQRMQSVLWRPGDTLASFGDGRFAILLPFTDAMGCATVAAKLRTAMLDLSAESDDGDQSAATTLSIGMATYVGYGSLPTQLMEFAEQALIDARRGGGDQACRYDPTVETLRPAPYRPAAGAAPPEEQPAHATERPAKVVS